MHELLHWLLGLAGVAVGLGLALGVMWLLLVPPYRVWTRLRHGYWPRRDSY